MQITSQMIVNGKGNLERFLGKLERVKDTDFADSVSREIATHARDYVSTQYFTEEKDVYQVSSGNWMLDVTGDGLLYKEYGTGQEGKNSPYPGTLPTRTFSFFSRGGFWVVNGWQYMYHPQTQKDGYWWFGGQKCYGQPARAGMWKTVQDARDNAGHIARNVIKGGL